MKSRIIKLSGLGINVILSLLLIGVLFPQNIYSKECDHILYPTDTYTQIDNDENDHYRIYKCEDCEAIVPKKENHDWSYQTEINPIENDNTYHETVTTCKKCGYKKYSKEKHFAYSSNITFTKIDDYTHSAVYRCQACNTKVKEVSKHSAEYDFYIDYTDLNEDCHQKSFTCRDCGELINCPEKHSYHGLDFISLRDIVNVDNTYHKYDDSCSVCGKSTWRYEKHISYSAPSITYKPLDANNHYTCYNYWCSTCYGNYVNMVKNNHNWKYGKTNTIVNNIEYTTYYKECTQCKTKIDYKTSSKILSPQLEYKSFILEKGYSLNAKLLYATKPVKWKSTNPKIASVNKKGKVTGKSVGKCKIYTKYGGKKYSIKVKVTKGIPWFEGDIISYNTRSNCFYVELHNQNKKTLTIYSRNAKAVDDDYKSFDRNLRLSNNINIKPGQTKKLSFKVQGRTTWYNADDFYVYFDFKYDGKKYRARVWTDGCAYKSNGKWHGLGYVGEGEDD